MRYVLFQYEFPAGFHFGNASLEGSEAFFHADTFFSALCIESLKKGEAEFEWLLNCTREGNLCFSDAMPHLCGEYYIPKPCLYVEGKNPDGDSITKKKYKKLQYIPVRFLDKFLRGDFPIDKVPNIEQYILTETRTRAAVRGVDETMPYRTGICKFRKDAGAYLLVGYKDEDTLNRFEDLQDALSLSGIGGERSSGLGRFDVYRKEPPVEMTTRLSENYTVYMTLSVSLPSALEMPDVVAGSHFIMKKRSGFVASAQYAPTSMRKKDLYVFQAGSCFQQKFAGSIYNVSTGAGSHPVYRYAKPVFLGVAK